MIEHGKHYDFEIQEFENEKVIDTQKKVSVGTQVVDIDLKEQDKYPVPGREGEFYKSRLDVENAQKFEWDNFIGACEEMGITTELLDN